MEKAIIRKEWIKTWRIYVLCLLVSVAMAVYAVIRMNRLIELKGAEHLWLIMLLKDNSFVDVVKWTPLFCGLVIALSQMVPEMVQKRLKLTLHLPYPQSKMILIMLGVGIVELLTIFIIQSAIIFFYDMSILTSELVTRVMMSMIPWFCAGFIAYIFTCAVCIEGKKARRILIALLGVAFVSILFEQSALEAYDGIILLLLLFIVCILALPLGSVVRFKEGLQD